MGQRTSPIRRKWVAFLLFVGAALTCFSRVVVAQSLRIRVVDLNRTPVASALVVLVDSVSETDARAITGEKGEVVLRAERAGAYQVRVNRIGFRSKLSERIQLQVGATIEMLVQVESIGLRLDTLRVASTKVCRDLDRSTEAFELLQQARTALLLTSQADSTQRFVSSLIGFERALDRAGTRVLNEQRTVAAEVRGQPWSAPPPDALHRNGYVVAAEDSTTYLVPSLEVFASETFASRYCFSVLATDDSSRIGLKFEPVRSRPGISDVSGTLWLRRQSAELFRVEFSYTNVPRAGANIAGGVVDLVRLGADAWVVSRWTVRMPVLARRRMPAGNYDAEWLLNGVRERGGELFLVTSKTPTSADPTTSRGAPSRIDTLWRRAPQPLTGQVVDSATGAPQSPAEVELVGTGLTVPVDSAAHFTFADVLPGTYELRVQTSAYRRMGLASQSTIRVFDSSSHVVVRLATADQLTRQLCASRPRASASAPYGVLHGAVLGETPTNDSDSPRVLVSWDDGPANAARGAYARPLTARVSESGAFRLCGVPTDRRLYVQAVGAEERSFEIPVEALGDQRIARVDLIMQRMAPTTTVVGTVRAQDGVRSIEGAEIIVEALDMTARSDARGEFRLGNVPMGSHVMVIRALGYTPVVVNVVASSDAPIRQQIILARITSLDTLAIRAARRMQSFDEHRRVGLGRFMTADEIDRLRAGSTSAVLTRFTGLQLMPGKANMAWAVSGRGPKSLSGAASTRPSEEDGAFGAKRACFAHVWLDGVQVYRGLDREPLFNVNGLSPSAIEGIEFYSGSAQTPPEYSGLKSTCGVLVIWTKR